MYRTVKNENAMPRPLSFDRDAAITAAMEVFWEHGYNHAPLSALTEATGLGKGSLYNAFGSKAELFALAFEEYQRRYSASVVAALNAPDLRAAIDGAFAAKVDCVLGRDRPPGCLAVGSLIDPPRDAPEIAARVVAAVQTLERLLKARLSQAVEEGQLPADADPTALARALTALLQGLAVTARVTSDVEKLSDIRRGALALLPITD
mgnify:CR=1 FL=1